VDPPPGAAEAAAALARALDAAGITGPPFPVVGALELEGADAAERALREAWRASLATVGADGFPPTADAGAVLRPFTAVKLTIRMPPTADPDAVAAAVARALTDNPPYGATVTWEGGMAAGGWAAPPPPPWLAAALDHASTTCFGPPYGQLGEGGTIPFMGWLAERFPEAHLLALGVLGPGSNAHGPDEGLHLPTAERVGASLALLLDAHAGR
jgi:acetylornithine deacetylase/succinyl-diaminopimelate desuccinylase-like protein